MASLNQTIKDIKNLKIQGAEAVAKEAAKALCDFSKRFKDKEKLTNEINKAALRLLETRPTEPAMKNSLKFILSGLQKSENTADLRQYVNERTDIVLKHFEDSMKQIAEFGSRKIKRGSIIYTHCHSSSVVSVLKLAKNKGIIFEVHNTETRPKFQGRITAKELAKDNIKVIHYVDSGAKYALKKADVMLIGADLITSEGFIANKIGSELFAEIAYDMQIPVYCCTDSWKFDPKTTQGNMAEIEERPKEEVWRGAPEDIVIRNPAFELIDSRHVTGIISELGVYKPGVFVEEVKDKYKWMFLDL